MAPHVYDLTRNKWISGECAPRFAGEAARPVVLLQPRAATNTAAQSSASSTCAAEARVAASDPAARATYTGTTPGSGAAAELRLLQSAKHRHLSVPLPDPSPEPSPSLRLGALREQVVDGLTVIAGLLVFSLIALFFLVLT